MDACWLFDWQRRDLGAEPKRTLEGGSMRSAPTRPRGPRGLHRLRSVLVRRGRDRLADMVEVDETYIGGEEPELAGGRARGKKVLTGIAVEVREPKGLGRCRWLMRRPRRCTRS